MSEKKIELRNMDPVEIFGVNDRLIIRLGGYFPKLKIIARKKVKSKHIIN